MWQYSSKGKVNGISTDVDLDYCYKDYPNIIKKAGLNGYKKDSLGLFVQPKLVYIDEGKVCWEINENNLNSLSKATKTIHSLLPTAEVGIKENVKIKKNVN